MKLLEDYITDRQAELAALTEAINRAPRMPPRDLIAQASFVGNEITIARSLLEGAFPPSDAGHNTLSTAKAYARRREQHQGGK